MTTRWVVSTAVNEITLDEQRRGEIAFTVTNQSSATDVAFFGPVARDGANPSWFRVVGDPNRPVPGGGSVSYVVQAAVPPDAPSGRYAVAGRVYSANLAPEETSETSNLVVFEVAGPVVAEEAPAEQGARAEPPKQPKRRRWPIAVAVVGGATVVFLVICFIAVTLFNAAPAGTIIEPEDEQIATDYDKVAEPREPWAGEASGGRYVLFLADGSRQAMSLKFNIYESGRYTISTKRSRGPDHGNVVLSIDWHQIGGTFRGFSNAPDITDWQTDGTVDLDEGEHTFALTVVGKAPDSCCYYAGIDAIRLEKQ